MPLYFFKKTLYLQVCKFEEKKLSVGKYFLGEYHRLEYCNRQVNVKFEGRGIFLSEISSRGAYVQKVPNNAHRQIWLLKTAPIVRANSGLGLQFYPNNLQTKLDS